MFCMLKRKMKVRIAYLVLCLMVCGLYSVSAAEKNGADKADTYKTDFALLQESVREVSRIIDAQPAATLDFKQSFRVAMEFSTHKMPLQARPYLLRCEELKPELVGVLRHLANNSFALGLFEDSNRYYLKMKKLMEGRKDYVRMGIDLTSLSVAVAENYLMLGDLQKAREYAEIAGKKCIEEYGKEYDLVLKLKAVVKVDEPLREILLHSKQFADYVKFKSYPLDMVYDVYVKPGLLIQASGKKE